MFQDLPKVITVSGGEENKIYYDSPTLGSSAPFTINTGITLSDLQGEHYAICISSPAFYGAIGFIKDGAIIDKKEYYGSISVQNDEIVFTISTGGAANKPCYVWVI